MRRFNLYTETVHDANAAEMIAELQAQLELSQLQLQLANRRLERLRDDAIADKEAPSPPLTPCSACPTSSLACSAAASSLAPTTSPFPVSPSPTRPFRLMCVPGG